MWWRHRVFRRGQPAPGRRRDPAELVPGGAQLDHPRPVGQGTRADLRTREVHRHQTRPTGGRTCRSNVADHRRPHVDAVVSAVDPRQIHPVLDQRQHQRRIRCCLRGQRHHDPGLSIGRARARTTARHGDVADADPLRTRRPARDGCSLVPATPRRWRRSPRVWPARGVHIAPTMTTRTRRVPIGAPAGHIAGSPSSAPGSPRWSDWSRQPRRSGSPTRSPHRPTDPAVGESSRPRSPERRRWSIPRSPEVIPSWHCRGGRWTHRPSCRSVRCSPGCFVHDRASTAEQDEQSGFKQTNKTYLQWAAGGAAPRPPVGWASHRCSHLAFFRGPPDCGSGQGASSRLAHGQPRGHEPRVMPIWQACWCD